MATNSVQEAAMLAKGYVPVRVVAEKAMVSVKTVYRHIKEGQLKTVEVTGKIYVPIQSAIDYIGPEGAKVLGLVKTAEEPAKGTG